MRIAKEEIFGPVTAILEIGNLKEAVDKAQEVVPVIKESLKIKDKPVFMEFMCDWKSKVFPMVPAGAAIDEMIFDED